LLTCTTPVNNPDKFGFYQVGDQKTYSKVEAIQLGKLLKKFPAWNFNDDEFAKHNWTEEPSQSLDDLYRQRAWQIRQRYDYIVIWYSGGADSFNVLNTFLQNDIPVDEIAHCWSFKGDNTVETLFNEEIARVAIPQTQAIQQSFPDIKHRVIDQSESIATMFNNDEIKHDFIYYSNNNFSPNGLDRSFLRETVPDYRQLIDQGKSIGFIWGTDKPRIHYDVEQDRYFLQFLDIVDNILSPRTQILARPWEHDEFFYWAPESAQMLIKQSHIIKRFLQQADESYNREYWFSTENPYRFGFNPKFGKHLTQHGLHQLIYPGWDSNTFQRIKTKSIIYGDRDRWFFEAGDSTTNKNFRNGINKIGELMNEESVFDMSFLNNTQDVNKGIVNFIGPRYYLS